MNLQQAYYELRFENAFLRVKGDSFQELYERLMGLACKARPADWRRWWNHCVKDSRPPNNLKEPRMNWKLSGIASPCVCVGISLNKSNVWPKRFLPLKRHPDVSMSRQEA